MPAREAPVASCIPMRRIILAAAIGFIASFALGLAALRATTDVGERGVFFVVLIVHCAGLTGTLARRGRDPRWLGFTVLGGAVFLVVTSDFFDGSAGNDALPASDLAETIFDACEPEPKPPVVEGVALVDEPGSMASQAAHDAYQAHSKQVDQRHSRRRHLAAVADLLLSLAAAVLGIPVGWLVASRPPTHPMNQASLRRRP